MCVRLIHKLHYQFKFERRYKLETMTLKNIRRYQKFTNLLIFKIAFARLVREILYDQIVVHNRAHFINSKKLYYRIQKFAIETL